MQGKFDFFETKDPQNMDTLPRDLESESQKNIKSLYFSLG
jgi:hypothetical protein